MRKTLVNLTVRHTAKRAVTYAGIPDNCPEASIEAAKEYLDLGIDAVVAHLPAYYPLDAENMLRFFEKLADGIPGPVIVYNIPITTHMSIPLETVDRLSRRENVCGLKDSEKDPERMQKAAGMWKDRDDFSHLCGSAVLSAKALLAGSDGIVPSTGNFAPQIYHDLYLAAANGEKEKAENIQEKTNEISKVYQAGRTLGQSLPALKAIMSEMGLCTDHVLPPLRRITGGERDRIVETARTLGILS
jgi:4-hydroxy-tetrahydrodipicolinate synthase